MDRITIGVVGENVLKRYTGSGAAEFQPYILLVNFKKHVDIFSKNTNCPVISGAAMDVCHSSVLGISVINFGVGSPLAALIIELLSFIKPKATLFLGTCGGLRDNFKIGEYFNPVAAIREEGTSFAYLPERCPSLSSFVIQRYVCEELERNSIIYHNGVIHTTNLRFWEFKEKFKQNLLEEQSQAIDMECATLFTVGFACKIAVGALIMITDLPLKLSGIKIQNSPEDVSIRHFSMGINVLKNMRANEADGFGYKF